MPQHLDDLGQRRAQPVMQPRGERHQTVSELRLGHRVHHRRFDQLLAARTPLPRDAVLRHLRLRVRDVFDQAEPMCRGIGQRRTALRTTVLRWVLLVMCDLRGLPAPRARMARLRSRRLLAAFGRRLVMRRNHPRGRRGRGTPARLLAEPSRQRQQHKDDRFRALSVDRRGLLPTHRKAEFNGGLFGGRLHAHLSSTRAPPRATFYSLFLFIFCLTHPVQRVDCTSVG